MPIRTAIRIRTCITIPLLTSLAVCLSVTARGAESPGSATMVPATPWIWQQPMAERLPGGTLIWTPRPFTPEHGENRRYIDFAGGRDSADGRTPETAWKHHPWDAHATNRAASDTDGETYLFKRGVTYRGTLTAQRSGTEARPIRLTIDPHWGEGEAVLAGSERIAGTWRRVEPADAPRGLPDPQSVWFVELGPHPYPTALFEIQPRGIERIPIARHPDWTVSDWDDVKSEWAVWKDSWPGKGPRRVLPEWQTGEERTWVSDPDVFTDSEESAYHGATLWTEYTGLMGSPYPNRIEQYDPARSAVQVAAPWTGNRRPIEGDRYFLENHPRFLDTPGEYWFDEATGRLYLRLSGDRNPNKVHLEAAARVSMIDIRDREWIHIAGLSFRFQRVPQWYHRFWNIPGEDASCIKALGHVRGIRVENCTFEHTVRAFQVHGLAPESRIEQIAFNDNDVRQTDYGALSIAAGGDRTALGDLLGVEILRNRIIDSGGRPLRAFHGHTVDVHFANDLVVAGNFLDRTYGAGIMIRGGKPGGVEQPVPFTRILIFDNQVENSCLTNNDWGGIETWQGGPAYVWGNVSHNPGGYWHALDRVTDEDWEPFIATLNRDYPIKEYPALGPARSVAGFWDRGGRNAYSARFAYTLYCDGAFKQYWFNNIASGKSNDLGSPLANTGGFHAVAGSFLHSIFNNTFYRLGMGSRRGGTFPAPDLFLGNHFVDMSDLFIAHERPKVNPDENASYTPDADPEGHVRGPDLTVFMQAFAGNAFQGSPRAFGVIGRSGRLLPDIDRFRDALEERNAIATETGTCFPAQPPLLRDPANGDFRSSPKMKDQLLRSRVFVPWALYGVVGEWNFYHLQADSTQVPGEHWNMTASHLSRGMYRRLPRHSLTAVNANAESYRSGVLENWIDGALFLNGKDQHLELTQDSMDRDITWGDQPGEVFPGGRRTTLDMDSNSFLIEAVLQLGGDTSGGPLVTKTDGATGYRLEIDRDGRPRLILRHGGETILDATASSSVAGGGWHHLLMEVDRSAKTPAPRFFLNGHPVSAGVTTARSSGASLANQADFRVGRGTGDDHLAVGLDFLRIARGTLADARTTIEELHAWQFRGPFTRDLFGTPVEEIP